MKGPGRGLGLLLAILFAAAYPFVVYFGLGTLGPKILAIVLAVFAVVRYFANKERTRAQGMVCGAIVCFAILIFILDSQRLLRLYPVLFSLGMAAAFYFSLYDDQTLIERVATQFGSELHDIARRYIRKLTVWWIAVLVINATISAWTALYGTLYQWTLFNGLLSYLLMGGFMAAEFCFRIRYKKAQGIA